MGVVVVVVVEVVVVNCDKSVSVRLSSSAISSLNLVERDKYRIRIKGCF